MKKAILTCALLCSMMIHSNAVACQAVSMSDKSATGQAVPIVFLEGNIGVGKSTFIKVLQKYLPSLVLTLEPCDEWQNIDGFNLLHEFYNSPDAWALIFQIYASMTRLRRQEHEAAQAQVVQCMERSWWTDRYCFAQMLHKSLKISDLQWKVYEQMWDWYMRNSPIPKAFIYLRATPQTCLNRLQKRSRSEEVGITIGYLEALHDCHEALLVQKTADWHVQNVPVLILDASLNFKDDEQIQKDFVRQILDFLKIHANIDLEELAYLD